LSVLYFNKTIRIFYSHINNVDSRNTNISS
jgi:hypothetical protein